METSSPNYIKIDPADNVAVMLKDTEAGIAITEKIMSRAVIPAGHKIALETIKIDSPVVKYGQVIGVAAHAIRPGEHVHTHNLKMCAPESPLPRKKDPETSPSLPANIRKTFHGILRASGKAGTRNYIGVLSSVNCSASVARFIADHFTKDRLQAFKNIDGVVALPHGMGCGDSTGSQGFQNLQRCLAGFAGHPNFGAVLLVGLGCEVLQVDPFAADLFTRSNIGINTLNIQDLGGTKKTVAQGVRLIDEMLPEVNRIDRQPLPLSHLTLGLECGGSDAFSGLTANPSLGVAVDLLVAGGGTAVLGETTEIYGTEQFLARRAVTPAVGQKIIERVQWWENYTRINASEINNNPSPGNKAGGLTTILEKSLGAVAKGGSTPLMAVYPYASQVHSKGLVFMDTPGYDPVSITGMIAGGANMICFTTGRGSVLGGKPVPVIKLATNSSMYTRMVDDMDIDCGSIVDGQATVQEMGRLIYDHIIDCASGRPTKSEKLGIGDLEFVPWQIGAVL